MIERASNAALLEFANAVREAGGTNPLDALMPARPHDGNECLIARALNFNCEVAGASDAGCEQAGDSKAWSMVIEDRDAKEIAQKISEKLDLLVVEDYRGSYSREIILPPEIAQAAIDFDKLWDIVKRPGERVPSGRTLKDYAPLFPLIEESMRETLILTAKRKEALGVT